MESLGVVDVREICSCRFFSRDITGLQTHTHTQKRLVRVQESILNRSGLRERNSKPCRQGMKPCMGLSPPHNKTKVLNAGRGATSIAALITLGKAILAVYGEQKIKLSSLGGRAGTCVGS